MKKTRKDFSKQVIQPHRVKSRDVELKDLPRVLKDGLLMNEIVQTGVGIWATGMALAHSQITKDDPLRFFVTNTGECIINPTIVRQVKHKQPKDEACLSFHDPVKNHGVVKVPRSHKCEVVFWRLEDLCDEEGNPKELEDMGDPYKENVKGKIAQMFQHEIEHFDAIYCYDHVLEDDPLGIFMN